MSVAADEPTLYIEVKLAGVWVDIAQHASPPESRRVLRCNIKRGKQKSLDKISAGALVLVLKNHDRHFDPDHNPDFAELEPGTPIRVRAVWAGNEHFLFTGKLDRTIDKYGPAATVIWESYDGLAELESTHMPSAWEVYNGTRSGMRAWYRLGETAGPYAFDKSGNARHGVYHPDASSIEYGVAGLVPGDSDGAVKFGANLLDALILPPTFMPETLPWTLNFFYQHDTNPVTSRFIFYETKYPEGLAIWIDTSGRLNVRIMQNGAIVAYARTGFSGANPNLNNPVQINARAGLPLRIMMGTSFDWSEAHIGTGGQLSNNGYFIATGNGEIVVMDEIQSFDASTTGDEETQFNWALQRWLADYGEDRVARILDYVGWTDSHYLNLQIGFRSFLQGTELNTTALDHIQSVVDTYEGRLFVQGDGELVAISGREALQSFWSAIRGTYGDDPSELPYIEFGDGINDWELLTNVVRRYHGEQQFNTDAIITANDPTSIAQYGTRDTTPVADVTSELYYPDYEFDLASFRVAHYAQPRKYIDGITISPRKAPADLWPRVLDDDIGSHLILVRRPQGIGDPIEQNVVIEGLEWEITPKKWLVKYSLDSTNAQRYFLFDETEWDSGDWRFSV